MFIIPLKLPELQFDQYNKHIVKCTINGKIHSYDFMGTYKNSYDNYGLDLVYIGYGSVYSINGIIQDSLNRYTGHFWKNRMYYPSTKKQKQNAINALKKKYNF